MDLRNIKQEHQAVQIKEEGEDQDYYEDEDGHRRGPEYELEQGRPEEKLLIQGNQNDDVVFVGRQSAVDKMFQQFNGVVVQLNQTIVRQMEAHDRILERKTEAHDRTLAKRTEAHDRQLISQRDEFMAMLTRQNEANANQQAALPAASQASQALQAKQMEDFQQMMMTMMTHIGRAGNATAPSGGNNGLLAPSAASIVAPTPGVAPGAIQPAVAVVAPPAVVTQSGRALVPAAGLSSIAAVVPPPALPVNHAAGTQSVVHPPVPPPVPSIPVPSTSKPSTSGPIRTSGRDRQKQSPIVLTGSATASSSGSSMPGPSTRRPIRTRARKSAAEIVAAASQFTPPNNPVGRPRKGEEKRSKVTKTSVKDNLVQVGYCYKIEETSKDKDVFFCEPCKLSWKEKNDLADHFHYNHAAQ